MDEPEESDGVERSGAAQAGASGVGVDAWCRPVGFSGLSGSVRGLALLAVLGLAVEGPPALDLAGTGGGGAARPSSEVGAYSSQRSGRPAGRGVVGAAGAWGGWPGPPGR
ncbi:hypothetical protein [Deinococcus aquaticus]|uniref:hypothetical protein n=1 Tax=Deinococcus aquaticus TaxID=328692 RepID=UPI00361FBC23